MAVQTQIQARRGTAATWTSTNPTLAAGETGYETDTGKFKIGTGSTAWASLGYFNQDPVTTKGDLFTFSTTDARLAVGSNGETLVADSAATTGLRYQSNFAAGKNKIINGAFDVWQRGSTVNLSNSTNAFLADRFQCLVTFSAGTGSISRQTFTPGTAPVAGYEGQYFQRLNTATTATYIEILQKIEDVRTLAGQNVTISFWAKASSAVTVKNLIRQNFGSGGSANVDNTANFNLTTSWQRFSRTIEPLGSLSGKTIGTNSYLGFFLYQDTGALGGLDIDLWGVQIEAGSVATAFQTATGTLQGELAACQRYFYRYNAAGTTGPVGVGNYYSTTLFVSSLPMKQTMRTTPSATFNNIGNFSVYSNGGSRAATAMVLDIANSDIYSISTTTSAATAGNAGAMNATNANATIDFSSEL